MVFFIFIQILIEHSVSNSGVPDQTPRTGASDLDLCCLPMSHKKDARLIWVYLNLFLFGYIITFINGISDIRNAHFMHSLDFDSHSIQSN